MRPTGDPTYTWMFGGLRPSSTGSELLSTRVESTTDLSGTPASGTTVIDPMGNQKITPDAPFTSVDDAYRRVQALLASSALTAAQKSGIVIRDVEHRVPGDDSTPVVAYTVDLRGDYNELFDMRLGDVQRSALNILRVVMQSSSFEQLAELQGVAGVSVQPYLEQFDDLETTLTQRQGPVVPARKGR